jgi:hypothetical protein
VRSLKTLGAKDLADYHGERIHMTGALPLIKEIFEEQKHAAEGITVAEYPKFVGHLRCESCSVLSSLLLLLFVACAVAAHSACARA